MAMPLMPAPTMMHRWYSGVSLKAAWGVAEAALLAGASGSFLGADEGAMAWSEVVMVSDQHLLPTLIWGNSCC